VVYGMPKEAVKLGAVDRSVPLAAIAREVLRLSLAETGAAERA
jgi:two-component system chemotaxis response regulator CheB